MTTWHIVMVFGQVICSFPGGYLVTGRPRGTTTPINAYPSPRKSHDRLISVSWTGRFCRTEGTTPDLLLVRAVRGQWFRV